MLSYIIILSKKAEKQLDKFDDKTVEPILNAIDNLATNPTVIISIINSVSKIL